MTAIGASPQGWRSWLLSNTPQSRLQAKLGALYHAWLSFLANPLALAGMVIVIALLLLGFGAALMFGLIGVLESLVEHSAHGQDELRAYLSLISRPVVVNQHVRQVLRHADVTVFSV